MAKSNSVVRFCPADGNFYTFETENKNSHLASGDIIETLDGEVAEVLGFLEIEGEDAVWFQIMGEPIFNYYLLKDATEVKILMQIQNP